MSAEWFLGWWNLIFLVPFMLALLYLAVYTVSGLTFGEHDFELHDADVDVDHDVDIEVDHDVDVDVDHDVEVDVDHDVDVDADADVDHDVDSDHHVDADHDADADADDNPFYFDVLLWLGMGRVPLSILLMILFLTWGAFGFFTNALLKHLVPVEWMTVLAALPIAAFGSSLITRGVARLVGRYMPSMETYSRKKSELVGTSGTAVSEVTPKFGLIGMRDKSGDYYQLPCRVYADAKPIAKGARVLIIDYDESQSLYYVSPYDVEVDRLPTTFRKD